jgi:hypothetical protein
MGYEVHYHHENGKVDRDMNVPDLEDAKARATKAVEAGTHERAEVRDEAGSLLFHCPHSFGE